MSVDETMAVTCTQEESESFCFTLFPSESQLGQITEFEK